MKMEMVESHSKTDFLRKVNQRLGKIGSRLFEIKLQRNLYYSLSGSSRKVKEAYKETSKLKEGYVAFIIWDERAKVW
jgi:hypothetical protein